MKAVMAKARRMKSTIDTQEIKEAEQPAVFRRELRGLMDQKKELDKQIKSAKLNLVLSTHQEAFTKVRKLAKEIAQTVTSPEEADILGRFLRMEFHSEAVRHFEESRRNHDDRAR